MEKIDPLGSRFDRLENALAGAEGSVLSAKARVEAQVGRNPYGTLAAALGLGYVLGGGLFTPLTARIVGAGLKIGLRVAMLPLLQQELAETAQEVLGLRTPPETPPPQA